MPPANWNDRLPNLNEESSVAENNDLPNYAKILIVCVRHSDWLHVPCVTTTLPVHKSLCGQMYIANCFPIVLFVFCIVFIGRIKCTRSSHVHNRSTRRIGIHCDRAVVAKVFLCVLCTHFTVNRRDIVFLLLVLLLFLSLFVGFSKSRAAYTFPPRSKRSDSYLTIVLR